MTYWTPGTQIQWIYRGRTPGVDNVRPMTVVRDDPGRSGRLAGRRDAVDQAGAHRRPRHPRGRSRADVPRTAGGDAEQLARARRAEGRTERQPWSIWHFWRTDGSFSGWYVNLERPHCRDVAARTTTTEDCVLDLWVTPDRVVRRKDEDELAMALQVGRFDQPVVAEIESWAALAEEGIAAWASPYRDGWQHWRPDPAWSLPPAPTGYDVRYVSEGAH